MAIRLTNDAGKVFWFTSGRWLQMLRFASRHGWPNNPQLDPDNWDDSLTWNERYEIIGGATLTRAESATLADALDRGVREDPAGQSVADELAVYAHPVREKLPDYDHARYAVTLLDRWLEFRDFVRGASLRVDLTD